MSISYRQRRRPVRRALAVMLGRAAAGDRLAVRRTDRFLTSYPRSGNTWLRFMVANLAHPELPTDFINVERRVPDVYLATNKELGSLPDPRFIKSHEPFTPGYRRVVYIVRDPRDVCVSYYYWFLKHGHISDDFELDRFTEAFVGRDLDPYGRWDDHVRSWLERERDLELLMVKYEAIADDAARELTRVAEFLELDSSSAAIDQAVQRSSSDAMQAAESHTGGNSRSLARTRSDVPFVRVSDRSTMKVLSQGSRSLIESTFAPTMQELGYL